MDDLLNDRTVVLDGPALGGEALDITVVVGAELAQGHPVGLAGQDQDMASLLLPRSLPTVHTSLRREEESA